MTNHTIPAEELKDLKEQFLKVQIDSISFYWEIDKYDFNRRMRTAAVSWTWKSSGMLLNSLASIWLAMRHVKLKTTLKRMTPTETANLHSRNSRKLVELKNFVK